MSAASTCCTRPPAPRPNAATPCSRPPSRRYAGSVSVPGASAPSPPPRSSCFTTCTTAPHDQQARPFRTGKGSVAEVARDLQMNDTTLGNWVKAERAERGEPDSSGLLPLTAEERAELTRLRRENARLKSEREILKKAALEDLVRPAQLPVSRSSST